MPKNLIALACLVFAIVVFALVAFTTIDTNVMRWESGGAGRVRGKFLAVAERLSH